MSTSHRRVAELFRMRAELMRRLAEVDGELAAAYQEAASDTVPQPKKKPKRNAKAPSLIRVPVGPEPTELRKAQAEAALRKMGYR